MSEDRTKINEQLDKLKESGMVVMPLGALSQEEQEETRAVAEAARMVFEEAADTVAQVPKTTAATPEVPTSLAVPAGLKAAPRS